MPWPEPRQDETEDEFIDRCMKDPYIQEDITDHDQRLAVCYGQWENRNKGGDMDLERKSFIGIELKKEKPGSFTAKIAELNVIDKDGDVTLPGAFPAGKTILISAYQHGSWMGQLPVGKGVIREAGNDVLVDGEFNLESDTGREHYATVKFAPDLQEWSYGFIVQEAEEDTEWEGNHVWRILKKLDVFEASPVLRGASMNTGMLAIKEEKKGAISYQSAHPGGTPKAAENESWDAGKEVAAASVDDLKAICAWVDSADKENKTAYKLPHHKAAGKHAVVWKGVAAAMAALLGSRGGVDIPQGDRKGVYNHLKKHYTEYEKEPPEFRDYEGGLTFKVQAEAALAAVEELAARAKSLADLRREEGRDLSSTSREEMTRVQKRLGEVDGEIKSLLDKPKDALSESIRTELRKTLITIKYVYGGKT